MRCAGAELRHRANPVSDRILSAPADSKLYFCMPEIFPAYKNARLRRGVKLRSRFTLNKILFMTAQKKAGRPKIAARKIYRYNFKLDDEQQNRLLKMMAETG